MKNNPLPPYRPNHNASLSVGSHHHNTISAPAVMQAPRQVNPPLLRYLRLLRKHWLLPLLAGVVCGVTAFIASALQRPTYRASTLIEVQSVNDAFLNMREVNPMAASDSSSADTYLDTQVKILRSRTLVARVVSDLELDRNVADAGPSAKRFHWKEKLGLPALPPVPASEQALTRTLDQLRVLTSRQNRVIEIAFDDVNPNLAAAVPNKLAEEYIKQTTDLQWNSIQRTSGWLAKQLDELRKQLQESEAQLQAYAARTGLVFTTEHQSIADERLRQAQEALSAAQAERIAKQSQYEMAVSSPAESLAEVLDSVSFREMSSKLNDLQRQLAELKSTFKPAYFRVKEVQAQVDQSEAALQRERTNILNRIKNDYESAVRRENMLRASYLDQSGVVTSQAGKSIQYNLLKQEVDSNRQLYDALLRKAKEAGVVSALHTSNFRVIDAAQVPSRPYKPNVTLNGVAGLLSGLLLGAFVVLIRASTDRSVQRPGETNLYLGIPELGAIPSFRSAVVPNSVAKPPLSIAMRAETSNGIVVFSDVRKVRLSPFLSIWQQDPSIVADSFRATLASIKRYQRSGSRTQILAVTSPGAGDGKTTIVGNLAAGMAENNCRVLVIDADLRRPSLNRLFGLENFWGLSNLLSEDTPVADYSLDRLFHTTPIPGVFLMTSGVITENAASLLQSSRLAELLARLRTQFDFVLIDTPPLLLPDARLIGPFVDSFLLVFRVSSTTHEKAMQATSLLSDDGTPIFGSILNGWEADRSVSRYYYQA